MLLGCPQQTRPSLPPPKYEHPPPYAVGRTPGQGGGFSEVRIHGIPDFAGAVNGRREDLVTRSSSSNSSLRATVLACVAFWMCGCLCGAVAFILAGLYTVKTIFVANVKFISYTFQTLTVINLC